MIRPIAILTRTASSSDDVWKRLKEKGFDVVLMPMIHIEPVQTLETGDLTDRGLVFSSVQAVHNLAPIFPGRSNPLFIVGERTAQAAQNAGFHNIKVVAPTGQALADIILKTFDAGQAVPLTHVRGQDVAFPFVEFIKEKNICIKDLICYSAILVEDFDSRVKAMVTRQDPVHVFFLSARAAARFETLTRRAAGHTGALSHSTALCLSARIAARLTPYQWGRIVVAPTPNQAGMVKMIEDFPLASCAGGIPPA